MIKHFIILSISLFLLTACGGNSNLTADLSANAVQQEVVNKKKPKIPKKNIARTESAQASTEKENKNNSNGVDMAQLVESINESLGGNTITANEIEKGWYFGKEDDKKIGTPNSWIWTEDSSNSRWSNPDAVNTLIEIEKTALCSESGGTYISSCVEGDSENCEYVSESHCKCEEGSAWVDKQGCILTDEEAELVAIGESELSQGWYKGGISSKKLNTPLNWSWLENNEDSKWQNPSPR